MGATRSVPGLGGIRAWLVVFLAAAPLAAAPVPKDNKPADQKQIVGTWKAEKTYMSGREVLGPFADNTFAFDAKGGMTWTLRGTRTFEFTFVLDPAAAPKRLTRVAKADGSEWRCLYELDGDKMKLAVVNKNAELPKMLEPGADVDYYELKRVPAPKPPGAP